MLIAPFDLINLLKTKNCNFPILRQSITIINFSFVPLLLTLTPDKENVAAPLAFARDVQTVIRAVKNLLHRPLKKGLKFQALFRKWF